MRRTTQFVALLLAITYVLTACASGPAASGGAGGGTLTRAMTDEPATIDPQGAANSGLNLVLPYLFDTLVTRQKDGKYVGLLAESWQPSADGKALDVTLKKNVKFHDGSPLNAAAVVFTFERFKSVGAKSPIASDIKGIAKVEATGDLSVRFTLAKPNAAFLNTLTSPYAGIMSPTAVKAAADDVGNKPVGTGPFKLGEWQHGVGITLLRNPDYNWGSPEMENRGPVRFDKLVFKLIPDSSTQLAALQKGDVDVVFVNEPSQLAKLKSDPNLHVVDANLDSIIYLGYNCAKAPFDDARVRQALSYAVNKDEIVKTAVAGLGTVATTPLPPTLLGYNADLAKYGQGYDPAKAKALLAEAGFSQAADGSWQRNGQKLAGKLLTSTRAPNDAIATMLQSQFKAIGVPVEIQQLDSNAVMTATTQGAYDILLWRYDWGDPDALNMYLSSGRIRQTNRVFYSNKQVDALFEQGLLEFDTAKRAKIYEEAQKLILTDAPWQPLYVPSEGMAFRNRVQGAKVGAMGRMLVNDVTLKDK